MSVTEQQRHLVASSFARLVPITNEATVLFYNRLWEIAPETQAMFRTDLATQGMKLMQTLGVVVRSLHDPDTLTPYLQDLGQRHIGYGVTREQYALVRQALLYMIEQCLHEAATQEVLEAWHASYDYIAEIATSIYEK